MPPVHGGLLLRRGGLDWSRRPLVMGVLNVTPDSFSDGGRYLDLDQAVAHGERMIADGADMIDVGAESTRPGSDPVPAVVQRDRAVPVIAALRRRHGEVVISIDTRVASVARAAIDAGADIVNDISALRHDGDMAGVVADAGVGVVLMHMKGTPKDMQRDGGPVYDDVVAEIIAFLARRTEDAVRRGIDRARIVVDPGLGFGKRPADNLSILKHLDRVVAIGVPVLVGASRKRFIGDVLSIDEPRLRDAGSVACAVLAAASGAAVVRVHDVRATVDAVRVVGAVRGAV
ncbi:MAG: dihydropteroate synthase [Phycisphaerae bacterium]